MNGKKKYIITVTKNPEFCGIGAAGLQFAHGKAVTVSERAAAWYREHEGYAVEEAGEKESGKASKVKEVTETENAEPDTTSKNEKKKRESKE